MHLARRATQWLLRAAGLGQGSIWSIINGMQPVEFQRNGREVRAQGWERNAVVNACARAIVDIIASVDFEVARRRPDGAYRVIPGHDAAELLNNEPRGGMCGYSYRANLGLHYILYGNSMSELERGGGKRVTGVRLIHPEQLRFVYINADDQITRYDWHDLMGVVHETLTNDMVHVRDLTATPGSLFGYPRAASALSDIAADSEATQYVRETVTNHGVPGLVAKAKGYDDVNELRRAEDRFNQRMTGDGGRGRTVFVNAEEIEFQQLGFDLRQLEFPDLRAVTREDICTAFNVDPRIIGIGSATHDASMSGVQYREARFRLVQQAVIPVMKAIESELNRWYMPEFGEGIIRFRPDALSEISEDETVTSNRILAEVAAGVRTIEEARETVGLTATLNPAHHFARPQTIPLVEVSVALDEAGMGMQEKAVQGGTTTPAKLPATSEPKLLAPPPPSTPTTRASQDTVRLWQAFDEKSKEEESTFLRILHGLFANDWVRLSLLFGAAKAAHSLFQLEHQVALLFSSNGPVVAEWNQQLRAALEQSIRAGARDVMRQAPMAGNLPEAQLLAAARQQAKVLAKQVNQTTLDQIQGLFHLAEAKGQTPEQLLSLIREALFDGAVDARTLRIARTEIPHALNVGMHLAAVESRSLQAKKWITQEDDRVRDSHRHAAEQGWIWVERTFNNGLLFPGDPKGSPAELINCRCTVVYREEPLP